MATVYPDHERDGYFLHNAVKLSELYPESFLVPSKDERYGIQEGAVVKLSFRFSHPESPEEEYDTERMWVIARERSEDHWIGELDNHPHFNPGIIDAGHLFHFHPDHIVAIWDP